MSEPFDIFITKYCLSAGIEAAKAYLHPIAHGTVIVADGRFKGMMLTGDQWHASEREARKWAETLRKRAIERDRERLAELEGLSFKESKDE